MHIKPQQGLQNNNFYIWLVGRRQNEGCRWECVPLLPTKEKTGEKSKKEEEQITFLINERQQAAKFHSIWRSSGWEVLKVASSFSAIWYH